VESWKERLPEGYTAQDIWNIDETGRALPEKGLAEKGKACHGGKKNKLSITVVLFVDAAGNKQKPIVVLKAANPRCFKHINKAHLPVTYFNQNNARMCGEIMHTVLKKVNNNLKQGAHSIILFMDNAG